MDLVRNVSEDGKCKYAIINLEKLKNRPQNSLGSIAIAVKIEKEISDITALLNQAVPGSIQYGEKGSDEEFFVIKLKDRYSTAALEAYANAIKEHDPEFSKQVLELASRSGVNHHLCKDPD